MKRLARVLLASAGLISVAAAPVQPSIGPGYQPQDRDERGLWMQADEYERQVAHSNFVIRDPALNSYVRSVFCRTVGEIECKDVRIYLMRSPIFNSAMAPNGMVQVWSGLFLRVRDEAQLAAVLGHEYEHYHHQHSLRFLRDLKKKTDAIAWLGFVPFGFIVQIGVAGTIFSYTRDMEREADAGSVSLLAGAGYDTSAASRIWEQVRAEMDATATARGSKSRKDKDRGMFQTHPPTAERMTELAALATKQHGATITRNEAAYQAALEPWWPAFVDDQIKLNDFGGTELLLAEIARNGWTGPLLFARAELYRSRGHPDDLVKAAGFYRDAIGSGNYPVEAFRGLGLALLRSGSTAEGRAALNNYLNRKPDASDRTMIAALTEG